MTDKRKAYSEKLGMSPSPDVDLLAEIDSLRQQLAEAQREHDRDHDEQNLVIERLIQREKQQEAEIGRLRSVIAEADPLDLYDARTTPAEYACRFCFGVGVYENVHKPDCIWVHAPAAPAEPK